MSERRSEVDLTGEEIEILLHWAERATRGVYPGCERYLTEAEERLLARLEELRGSPPADAPEDG